MCPKYFQHYLNYIVGEEDKHLSVPEKLMTFLELTTRINCMYHSNILVITNVNFFCLVRLNAINHITTKMFDLNFQEKLSRQVY